MKSNLVYECEICHKTFDNELDAISCEKEHTLCPCLIGEIYRWGYRVVGYGKYGRGFVDFSRRQLGYILPVCCDQNETILDDRSISYCPFCGRSLIDSTGSLAK